MKVSGTAGAITSSPDNLATDSVWIETDLVEPATIGAADTPMVSVRGKLNTVVAETLAGEGRRIAHPRNDSEAHAALQFGYVTTTGEVLTYGTG
jgi:hypothetical protein